MSRKFVTECTNKLNTRELTAASWGVECAACTGARSRDQVQLCVLHVLVLAVETRCSCV